MAGSLIKIQETTVTSAVASVTLTGIDSTYDVYQLVINDLTPVTINADMKLRVTESGTPNTTSNYDRAAKLLKAYTTFSNLADVNTDGFLLSGSLNNTVGKGFQCIVYIFNANNSSEYTFMTHETNYIAEDTTSFLGMQGGGVYTQTTTVDGVNITMVGPTSNIASGARFVLYGLKK
jgi:hypothetical protein